VAQDLLDLIGLGREKGSEASPAPGESCWPPARAPLTCFTAMLTRTELMEPSMRTFSFSFLLMITGCNSSSLLLLRAEEGQGWLRGNHLLGRNGERTSGEPQG